MRTVCYLFLLTLATILSGCFAPVNLSFENAKLLDKGEVKVQASYSSYYGPEYNATDPTRSVHYHNNFGVGLGYGISDNFNLSLRYERFNPLTELEIFGETIQPFSGGINYIEVGNKIRILKNNLAASIPLAVYIMEDMSFFSIDPRLYGTYRINNNVETTLTPKVHLIFGEGTGIAPGLSLGLGLSSNLDKWAFRPEIGYDGYFSFGFGINLYLKK